MLILVCVVYKENRLYISVNRTFWCKKIYSITIMRNDRPIKEGISYATGLFTIPLRNRKKLIKWDDDMFKNDKCETYNT